VLDFGSNKRITVHHVEEEDVDVLPTATAPTTAEAVVTPTVPVPVPVPAPKEVEVEAEAEAEEEEEEPVELEEFEYQGATYYKDPDNNVYEPNADGEVDADAPIGRWLESKKFLKRYTSA